MKNLLIAGLVGLAQSQNADIITNQNQIAPPSDGGVIFNQDGENHVVEYRKDFNEDDCEYTFYHSLIIPIVPKSLFQNFPMVLPAAETR